MGKPGCPMPPAWPGARRPLQWLEAGETRLPHAPCLAGRQATPPAVGGWGNPVAPYPCPGEGLERSPSRRGSGADRTYERRRALWRWDALPGSRPLPLSSEAGEGRPEPCAGAFQCGISHVSPDVLSALKHGGEGKDRTRHPGYRFTLWEARLSHTLPKELCTNNLPAR